MGNKYTVIIPHYNDVSRMEKLLDSLDAQTFTDYEALVIDDFSPDEAFMQLEALLKNRGKVRLVRAKKNGGPAATRNLGIKNADSGLLVFTDSDCILPQDWLEKIDAFYSIEKNSEIVLQGKVRMLRSGIIGDSISSLGFPAGGSIGFENIWPVVKGQTRQLVTCNCVIPRVVLEKVGLFDISFPVPFGEDTDLGLRIIAAGHVIRFYPQLYIYHPARSDLRSFLKWTWSRGRGAYYFKSKHRTGGYVKTRLWSSKNILLNGLKSFRFPVIALFLFLYLAIFYISMKNEARKQKCQSSAL